MNEHEIKIRENRSSEHLRERSLYGKHADEVRHGKMDHSVTPPANLNLELIKGMPALAHIKDKVKGSSVQMALLGIAEPSMVHDFTTFIKDTLDAKIHTFSVIDVDKDMIDLVNKENLIRVNGIHTDAQNTHLKDNSQDLVVRDHLGNCCPPHVDKGINQEVARILKPGGISIVNITTSELLRTANRQVIDQATIPDHIVQKLNTEIYDIENLQEEVPQHNVASLKGKLLEIDSPDSFVIFDDTSGDGEWFRTIGEHIRDWQKTGLHVIDMKMRIGSDSHTPTLPCIRFNVILEKL